MTSTIVSWRTLTLSSCDGRSVCSSSSPRAFSSSGVVAMVIHRYTLPLCPPLTSHFVHIFYTFTRVVPPAFLSSSPSLSWYRVLVHLTFLLNTCPSSLNMSVPAFSLIFFVAGATFTDPLACLFLILSFFVTPHIHHSILISFISILFDWLVWVELLVLSSLWFDLVIYYADNKRFVNKWKCTSKGTTCN